MTFDPSWKQLTDHKISQLNRACVEVHATDARDVDGAHHDYLVTVLQPNSTELVSQTPLHFQKGALNEAGVNGLTDQALLAVVLDRLRGFQSGPFGCRDNAVAITKLEEVLMWMEKRYKDRSVRGVEGVRAA